MPRRDLFSVFLIFGLLLAGCSKHHGGVRSDAEDPLHFGRHNGPQLKLLLELDYLPDSVIALFEKESGIHVQKEIAPFDVGILGSVLTAPGQYDLVIFDDWVIGSLIREKMLSPLHLGEIPNLKNIAPEFLNQPFDPGNRYSVPYLAGILGIVVNTDLVKSEIRDFPDVFRPEFDQKCCMVDAPDTLGRIARRASGNLSEGALTEEELETIRPLMTQWLSRVRLLHSDNFVPLFQNGKVAMGILWSGQAAELLNENHKFRWVAPSSPTRFFIDSFVIPKHAEHQAEAEAFINFTLRPEIGKMIAQAQPYLSPNAASRALISEKDRSNPASYPDLGKIQRMVDPADDGTEQLMVDRWIQEIQHKDPP